MLRSSTLAAVSLAFALGFAASKYTQRPPQQDPAAEEAKQKLQQLADVDIEDYYRLKSQEERYAKAEEILAKMMGIFMADLGLRVKAPAKITTVETPVKLEPEPARALPPPIPAVKAAEAAPEAGPEKNWKGAEGSLLSARDQGEVIVLLRKARIQELEKELKASSSFGNRNGILEHLQGNFSGTSRVDVFGKLKTWIVGVDLNAEMHEGTLDGRFRLTLAENGKIFSDSTASGSIAAIRELNGESRGLLFKAEDNTYLQVYYLKDVDQLAVNLYKRKSEADSFTYIGSGSLRRQ